MGARSSKQLGGILVAPKKFPKKSIRLRPAPPGKIQGRGQTLRQPENRLVGWQGRFFQGVVTCFAARVKHLGKTRSGGHPFTFKGNDLVNGWFDRW